jgi:hypothetical protein
VKKKDVWEDPEVKEWLESAGRDMLPKMKDSALSIAIFSGTVDPKLCMEIGAAILYDKPIMLLVTDDQQLPPTLEKIAAAVVRGDPCTEATKNKLTAAISRVMPHKA